MASTRSHPRKVDPRKRIGILMIHGIGEKGEDFDVGLRWGLESLLGREVVRHLAFKRIWFHGVLDAHQREIWEAMTKQPLDFECLRRFFLFYFSDALTYEGRPDVANAVYRRVHWTVKQRLDELRDELHDEGCPIIIFAHSLGCQVISNYIWDVQATRRNPGAPKGIWSGPGAERPTGFQALETLRYLFTSGCNIPLFVSGFDPIVAIHRPSRDFEWINYYDRDDVLGWPLRPLGPSYRAIVQDVPINVGWTPLSHGNYWTHDNFLRPVARRIDELIRSLAAADATGAPRR